MGRLRPTLLRRWALLLLRMFPRWRLRLLGLAVMRHLIVIVVTCQRASGVRWRAKARKIPDRRGVHGERDPRE